MAKQQRDRKKGGGGGGKERQSVIDAFHRPLIIAVGATKRQRVESNYMYKNNEVAIGATTILP